MRKAGAERIFLDLKLHDIPRTVAGAVGRLNALGLIITVHTGGGREMLSEAAAAAGDMTLLGVSVLTSLDQDEFERRRYRATPG